MLYNWEPPILMLQKYPSGFARKFNIIVTWVVISCLYRFSGQQKFPFTNETLRVLNWYGGEIEMLHSVA